MMSSYKSVTDNGFEHVETYCPRCEDELKVPGMPPHVIDTHINEIARYEKWKRTLGNVPNAQLPVKNTDLQNRITAHTLSRLFRVNQPLYNLIKAHVHANWFLTQALDQSPPIG